MSSPKPSLCFVQKGRRHAIRHPAVFHGFVGDAVSMRWVLIHMIEDTARHAGHMDILREQIDEVTGR